MERGQHSSGSASRFPYRARLSVAPVDLLNHDTENDDIGHIVELMRKNPDYVQKIMHRVKPLVAN
jgi:hypothetical protein